MANSITLSQSLVNDISQKITDGTATAEQVVLYTKGLNQLQTGNDFQSVVIGLSQSAVDAIDSANSQFQEDSQTALNTFSSTASTIDTSASNAVSAINVAKDTLVATDTEITSTINALPNQAALDKTLEYYTSFVSERTNDVPKWDGVHPLPRLFKPMSHTKSEVIIDHPWKAPAFLMNMRSGYSTYDGVTFLVDHDLNVIDEAVVHYNDILYTTGTSVNQFNGRLPQARYQYWGQNHDYYIQSNEATASSSDSNQPSMTGYMANQYGLGRYMHNTHTFKGLHQSHFGVSNNYVPGNERGFYGGSMCTIVGDTNRDYVIARPYNMNKIILSATLNAAWTSYGRLKRPNRRNDSDYWQADRSWETFQNWGKYNDDKSSDGAYPGDAQFHDRLEFPYHNSGYGLTSYNAGTGKFLFIETEAGESYEWKPKVYTVNPAKKLRDIALGRVDVSAYDANPVTEGILTLEIDGSSGLKALSRASVTTTNYSTYDRYHGQVVLCDNDTIIVGNTYDNGASQMGTYFHRYTKNTAGDDYEYDTTLSHSGNTLQTSADYGGMVNSVSNDGKYVILYSSYYYYGSGFNAVLVRVSDGAMMKMQYGDTSRGFNVIPIKHNKFLVKRSQSSNTTSDHLIDCDYIFAKHADGTDINSDVFGTTDHQEYNYTRGLFTGQMQNNHYAYSGTYMGIYNPYNYMMDYFDTNGKLKPEYDRLFNTI